MNYDIGSESDTMNPSALLVFLFYERPFYSGRFAIHESIEF